ncbi:MerR family transcriptional regulator [Amycolatopsis sp. NPDC052450]|uniref:MerR family transcriptional regulator n=1 Tax=Amycolatopsis sp. NPDC052450 TaxID=3363937 RepID=UPI0037C82A67
MRVAELSRCTGIPLPTIKYYLREGLLFPGVRTSPNQARYDERHVRRLHLIRALIDVGGLSVNAACDVLEQIDSPGVSVHSVLGKAQCATPPRRDHVDDDAGTSAEDVVRGLLTRRDWKVKDTNPSLKTLAEVVATLVRLRQERLLPLLDAYAEAAELMAGREVAELAKLDDVDGSAEAASIWIVFGDVLMSALRRLAQENASRVVLNARVPPAASTA